MYCGELDGSLSWVNPSLTMHVWQNYTGAVAALFFYATVLIIANERWAVVYLDRRFQPYDLILAMRVRKEFPGGLL